MNFKFSFQKEPGWMLLSIFVPAVIGLLILLISQILR